MVGISMSLTTVQRSAVAHDGNTLLVACPGSGKTRCIVAKVLRCLPSVRDTARRIACITYTNAAVHEIERRIRILGRTGDEDYCEVSTIHSFCLNNILRHFYWQLSEVAEGFLVLPSESERYGEIVADICKRFKLDGNARDSFERLSRDPAGSPVVSDPLTVHIANAFWAELAKEGFIDFANIVYLSYKLVVSNPNIARNLACRFPWILIDEFQDTSLLQVALFRVIAAQNRTNFFLVGDPFQSIYGFAQASPRLVSTFATEIDAKSDFALSDNFRSSRHVVAEAEGLLPRIPKMVAVGENAGFAQKVIYLDAAKAFDAIMDEFLPLLEEHNIPFGNAAILSPTWVKLFQVGRQLREFGIPVVGPGARPYRRSRVFAPLAEDICGYLARGRPEMIPQIERQLFTVLSEVTGRMPFSIFSYEGRCVVYRLIRIGADVARESGSGSHWLREASSRISETLVKAGLLAKALDEVLPESAAEMIVDMRRNKVDVENLDVESLGLFACPEHNLKLLTIHASKGREFDGVALIDLHEGCIPHYRATSQMEMDGARRVLYVGTTRARKVLVYITDRENSRNRPSRFLGDLPCCKG